MNLGSLWSEVVGFVRDEVKGRRELRKIEVQAKADIAIAEAEAEISLATRELDAEIAWDLIWAKQAEKSFKDDWFTYLHSLPLILLFIPSMQPFVKEGFRAMGEVIPDWFLIIYALGVASAFGYRKLVNLMMKLRHPLG